MSNPVKSVNGRPVVDLYTYIPGFFIRINNSLSRGASQKYREEFGIGIVEWRVMAMLAIEPKIHAVRICHVISTDKGQVSRALVSLNDADLAECEIVSADVRKKKWQLTKAGCALHDQILLSALERERKLIAGCDPEDLESFLRVARIMDKNVSQL